MATSLDHWQNIVLFHHRHVKRFHVVKRLWKSVQYIRRYSTKYVESRRQHATQFRLASSQPKLLDHLQQNFTRYSGISGAIYSCTYAALSHTVSEYQSDERVEFTNFCTKSVAMATALEISKKRSRSIIYGQKAFIRCKDCENRSGASWDIVSEKSLKKIKKKKR